MVLRELRAGRQVLQVNRPNGQTATTIAQTNTTSGQTGKKMLRVKEVYYECPNEHYEWDKNTMSDQVSSTVTQ